jgi:hypothetical protein
MLELMDRALEPVAPRHRLFWGGHVAAATFFGSPLAGASVLSLNYYRLGREMAALISFAVGVAVMALLVALSVLGFQPRVVVGVASLVGAFASVYVTDRLQGEALADHVDAGGKSASAWIVAGIILVSWLELSALYLASTLILG